jgi:Carboxypeptidase regulatory-like domain
MLGRKCFLRLTVALLALCMLAATPALAQKKSKNKQQPTTGGISGRVRVDAGASAAGISVEVRQGESRVAETTTSAKGEFEFRGLAPGSYGLTLRKSGLQVGRTDGIEVRAGKTVSLKDHLFLPRDQGTLALLSGSVFDAAGRSFAGARVELARVEADGSLKRLDSRVANSIGTFRFDLPPARARYRLTAKADGMEASTQDVDVEGAAIYRAALTLKPAAK